MNQIPDDARHLTLSNLDLLWSAGSPLVLPVRGSPYCQLRLDPTSGKIILITDYQTPEPDVAKLRNVSFSATTDGAAELAEITVSVEGNVHGAYGLLATIVDELQVARIPLAAAVASGVAHHRSMLALRGGLTTEQEIGLFGELLFLEYLVHTIGAAAAVESWQGPLSEEHDFVFDTLHVEIKSTVSERRRHMISGLYQLVPLRGVSLSVISIQLTRSAPDVGQTLPSLVTRVRETVGGHVVAVDQRLVALGWNAEDADLSSTRWTLRSEPRAYAVGHDFPAMTPERIGLVVPNFARVSDVSYRVDLTDMNCYSIPDPMSGFVETEGS